MSTPIVCNTLVPGRGCSCSGLFVGLRDHYSQDTAAEISVRSVGSGSNGFLAAKSVDSCKARGDSTTYPLPNPVCEFRTKIENIGLLRGPILRLRRCADK